MKSPRASLIIIPGLGDTTTAYNLVIPVWRALGYDVSIFSFGWEDKTESFQSAFDRLLNYIDSYNSATVYLIGVSAGGTAAVNALMARGESIKRLVTVATPYKALPHLKNAKLKSSIERLEKTGLDKLGADKILSIYGIYDQTVPTKTSQPLSVQKYRIFAMNHAVIIALALTLYSLYIRRFFTED